jgi:hypothetical protein
MLLFIQNLMLNTDLKSDCQKSLKKSQKSKKMENNNFLGCKATKPKTRQKHKYDIRTPQSRISQNKWF